MWFSTIKIKQEIYNPLYAYLDPTCNFYADPGPVKDLNEASNAAPDLALSKQDYGTFHRKER